MTYAVREMFATIQGEGYHSGRRAVFVRMAGCNVWSGRDEDRERDTAKGCCAAWCDTEFRGTDGVNGGKYTPDGLARKVVEIWNIGGSPFVVITGGEPSLQVDAKLIEALHAVGSYIAIETNGSHMLPVFVDWITLSPKPPMQVLNQRYNEVKVVYPAVDPLPYARCAQHRFVQPLDDSKRNADSLFRNMLDGALEKCKAFVFEHPDWRLSLQTHKLIGLP